MRGVLVRSLAVLFLGLAALGVILYYASTVDGRAPWVERIGLTQHLSADDGVALTTTSIEVTFSEPVDQASAQQAFRIEPPLDGSFTWSGPTLTFTPAERLPLETDFSVHLEPGVRDVAGNTMADASGRLDFRTVGHPTVVSSSPERNAREVPLESPIVLRFSTLMDTASVEDALEISPHIALDASWSGEELTLTPARPLAADERYTLRISADALDAAGTPLQRPYRLSFRTATSSLSAQTLFPADDAEGIAVRTPIAIVFDREIAPESLDPDAFSIRPDVAGAVAVVELPGAAGIQQPGPRVIRFQPSAPLAPNTTYTVTLRGGIDADDGSRLSGTVSWRFTTGAPQAVLSNQVTFISARAGVANLWTMNPDGTGERQLSTELSPVVDYAVAPDGRTFIVGDGAVLVSQHPDGSDRRVLTPEGVLEFDPSYAPDGSRLVFGRADKASGAGLGLWVLERDAGEAEALDLPAASGTASPSPSPSPSGSAAPEPAAVLRTPRFSPDGSAIAFVDLSGRVGVLDLEADALAVADWVATGAPVWLPDGTAVLVPGLGASARPLPEPEAGVALPPLDPAALDLPASRTASLSIGHLVRDGRRVVPGAEPGGAVRPAVAADGRYAYVVADPADQLAAGEGWSAAAIDGTPRRVPAATGRTLAVTFGVAPGRMLVTRLPASSAGIDQAEVWLVGIGDAGEERLTQGGWLPRWLP